MTYSIGIDPGLSGAIATLDSSGRFISVIDTPVIADAKAKGKGSVNVHALAEYLASFDFANIAIEHVHSMPSQGISSAFTFGKTTGATLAVAQLSMHRIHAVTPQAWKKYFGIGKDKELARARAIALFPDAAAFLARKKDSDRAESILIAAYCYEKFGVKS